MSSRLSVIKTIEPILLLQIRLGDVTKGFTMKDLILLITMWIVTICTYISYVPQIVKILKTKSSEDISVWSWVLWTLSSFCNFIYSVVLGRSELVIAGVSELFLTAVVLLLSLLYKHKPHTIELCGLDIYVGRQEWYLLSCIVESRDTKPEVLSQIANECTVPAVLQKLFTSDNPRITDEMRATAKTHFEKITQERQHIIDCHV